MQDISIEQFLNGFKESNHHVFCHFSEFFALKWENQKNAKAISKKAEDFLIEENNSGWNIGILSYTGNYDINLESDDLEVIALFNKRKGTEQISSEIRIKFLKWCIEKGYKNMQELFE